jgi:hypothetical protein
MNEQSHALRFQIVCYSYVKPYKNPYPIHKYNNDQLKFSRFSPKLLLYSTSLPNQSTKHAESYSTRSNCSSHSSKHAFEKPKTFSTIAPTKLSYQ